MTTVAAVKEIGSTIELNVANISRNRCLCIWLCVFLEGEEGGGRGEWRARDHRKTVHK